MDLELLKQQYREMQQQRHLIEIIEKPNDWREIRLACRDYRERWLEEHKNDYDPVTNTVTPKKNPPTRLTELAVAQGMEEILYIVNLSNDRVAVYDPDHGYYHKDPSYAYKIIRLLEPNFSEARAKNILFMLAATPRVNQHEHFSCNFSTGEYKDPKRFILVKNGIYDKKRKFLTGFTHEFIAFSTIATEYNHFAKSPTIDGWNVDDWLLDLTSGDEELVHLIWQVISASLNGNYSYRKSIWFVGEGNDGKGTVQQLITNVVGMKNVASLKINQFAERFSLSMIEGKTVVIGDDVQAGIYVDESSNFNSVVTGEPVLVEEKNKQPYTTVFKKTVIQSTNELPRFKNKTNGTYRRFAIIPFKKSFSSEDDNWAIKDDYIYREEVLEYVLKKALEISFDRFIEPKASLEALEDFKESNDTVKAFVMEWFNKFESTRLPSRYLWWLYQEWCKDEGVTKLTKRKFENQLAKNIPPEWVKKKFQPLGKFVPSVDVPPYYIGFSWGDDENKIITTGYEKINR